jgi:hypothetical protein
MHKAPEKKSAVSSLCDAAGELIRRPVLPHRSSRFAFRPSAKKLSEAMAERQYHLQDHHPEAATPQCRDGHPSQHEEKRPSLGSLVAEYVGGYNHWAADREEYEAGGKPQNRSTEEAEPSRSGGHQRVKACCDTCCDEADGPAVDKE